MIAIEPMTREAMLDYLATLTDAQLHHLVEVQKNLDNPEPVGLFHATHQRRR